MTVQILNRSWKISPKQVNAVLRDELSRRQVFAGGAMVCLGAALAACGQTLDLATLAPTIVGYVQNIGAALAAALGQLSAMGGTLPAGWAATLAQIASWVASIKSIAAGISTATLVSTAGGSIATFVTDFNNIVNAIVTNPVVAALVAPTGFGWALTAAAVLLPLVEQAVQVVINIVKPPAPAPLPASGRMAARLTAPLDPDTANLILQEIASGQHA